MFDLWLSWFSSMLTHYYIYLLYAISLYKLKHILKYNLYFLTLLSHILKFLCPFLHLHGYPFAVHYSYNCFPFFIFKKSMYWLI